MINSNVVQLLDPSNVFNFKPSIRVWREMESSCALRKKYWSPELMEIVEGRQLCPSLKYGNLSSSSVSFSSSQFSINISLVIVRVVKHVRAVLRKADDIDKMS